MRNLIRKLAPGAVLLGLLALVSTMPAAVGDAQDVYGFHAFPMSSAEWAGNERSLVGDDDTDVAFIVKYVGVPGTGFTGATTTMEVNAGDVTFLLTGSAVTTFECPVSGAYGGVIDVTNAACDTLGEIEDIINLYGYDDGWRIVLIDGKRSDLSAELLNDSAETVATQTGATAFWDTSAAAGTGSTYISRRAVLTAEQRKIDYYLEGPDNTYRTDPFAGLRNVVMDVQWLSTYASGTSEMNISEEDFVYTDVLTGGTPTMSIGTENTVYSQISGATTASADTTLGNYGLFGSWGRKMFVEINNSAAQTVVTTVTQAFQISRSAGR